MLFNSPEFIFFFLPVTVFIFFLISHFKLKLIAIIWLVIASLFFYGYWNFKYLILIISSIFFNYSFGILIAQYKHKKYLRKILFIIGIIANLGLLFYFKYANFFLDNINTILATNWNLGKIILPLGISFFTFQQLAYLIDIYQEKIPSGKFIYYCLFVSFFPQLIAGPIVHYHDILPQFYSNKIYQPKIDNLAMGITIFSLGLFKKIVLADNIAMYANPLFEAADKGLDFNSIEAWVGALAYTFQLYFDFSGYSDMAIGIGRMFGIQLPLNFYSPYKSINIIEFWRRWHITLSNFLRDYLYIPLGGSKKGNMRRYFNLMTTMLLGGLWHGAGWNFVFWGGLHGFYLVINHGWNYCLKSLNYDLKKSNLWLDQLAWLITFIAVIISWVFFRATTFKGALKILTAMFNFNYLSLPVEWHNLSNPFMDLLTKYGVQFQGIFNNNVVVSATDMSDQIELIIVFLIMFIITFFFPNIQEFMSKYESALNTSQFKKKSPLQFNFRWQPNIFWSFILGLSWTVLLLNSFNAAPSQFLYFQF